MILWNDWEYRTVSAGLDLGPRESSPPAYWREGIRSIEATIQTLLAFHLEAFTGLPLRLVRAGGALDSSADLIATDALGRVHLFELKQKAVNEQAASQMEQYLLRHVFADPETFIAEAKKRGRSQFSQFEVAKDILGLHANDRPEGFGLDLVKRHFGGDSELGCDGSGHRLTTRRWPKLPDDEKLVRIHASLRLYERSNRSTNLPDLSIVNATAERWSEHLQGDLSRRPGDLVSERPLVVWLVGWSITSDALERVRLWRRSGVDARILLMTARKDNTAWTVRTRREQAPGRDRAELELLEASLNRTSPATAKIEFYEEVAASTNRRHGGDLLANPKVRLKN